MYFIVIYKIKHSNEDPACCTAYVSSVIPPTKVVDAIKYEIIAEQDGHMTKEAIVLLSVCKL